MRLKYQVHGDGEPVVLLGGLGMQRDTWQFMQQPALLAAGFKVVAIDLRGSGESPSPLGPYRVAELAEDVAEMLAELDVPQARFVGVSLGGLVVEELCAARPHLVRSAVMLASAGPTTAYVRAWVEAIQDMFTFGGAIPERFFIAENLAYALPPQQLQDDDAAVTQWVELLKQVTWDTPGLRGQYSAWISWMLDDSRMERWPSIHRPVLICALEHDLLFPPRCGRIAAEAMPHAEFLEIPGFAHNGVLEAAPHLDPPIIDFFTRN